MQLKDIIKLEITLEKLFMNLLFDPGHNLEERILLNNLIIKILYGRYS